MPRSRIRLPGSRSPHFYTAARPTPMTYPLAVGDIIHLDMSSSNGGKNNTCLALVRQVTEPGAELLISVKNGEWDFFKWKQPYIPWSDLRYHKDFPHTEDKGLEAFLKKMAGPMEQWWSSLLPNSLNALAATTLLEGYSAKELIAVYRIGFPDTRKGNHLFGAPSSDSWTEEGAVLFSAGSENERAHAVTYLLAEAPTDPVACAILVELLKAKWKKPPSLPMNQVVNAIVRYATNPKTVLAFAQWTLVSGWKTSWVSYICERFERGEYALGEYGNDFIKALRHHNPNNTWLEVHPHNTRIARLFYPSSDFTDREAVAAFWKTRLKNDR